MENKREKRQRDSKGLCGGACSNLSVLVGLCLCFLLVDILRATLLFVYTTPLPPNRPIIIIHVYQIYPKPEILIKHSRYGNIKSEVGLMD